MLAVDVLNPRLARFSNGHGRALTLSCSVLTLVVCGMAGMIYYQRDLSFGVQSSMMSIGSATANIGVGSIGMCETNTTRSTVLQELVRSASAPMMVACSPETSGAPTWISAVPTGDFDVTLSPVEKYASIWAPILTTMPSVTRIGRAQYCDHYENALVSSSDLDGGVGATNESMSTLRGCFEAAASMSALAFSFGDGAECAVYRECSHPISWPSMTTYFIGPTPDLECYQNRGGISGYRPAFAPMHAYAQLLGLAPPALEDGIFTRRVVTRGERLDVVGFRADFVAVATELHLLLSKAEDDYDMPCMLSGISCNAYRCFDGKATFCDYTGNVRCERGSGIVSTKTMQKHSWLQSILAAVALSHNMEIAASAFVVITFLFVCLSTKERQDVHMGYSEMSSIILEKKNGESEKLKAALQDANDKLRTLEETLARRHGDGAGGRWQEGV